MRSTFATRGLTVGAASMLASAVAPVLAQSAPAQSGVGAATQPAATTPSPATPVGPDLLQTLSIGARSIALGSAFSAIADDGSALFWNPARLGGLQGRRFEVEYRSLFETRSNVTNGAPRPSSGVKRPEIGYAGVTVPGRGGTLALGYVLGGFYHNSTTFMGTNNGTTQKIDSDLTVRNGNVILAYGMIRNLRGPKPKPKAGSAGPGGASASNATRSAHGILEMGVNASYITQTYNSAQFTKTTDAMGTTVAPTANDRARNTAHGVAYGIGMTFQPQRMITDKQTKRQVVDTSPFRFAVTYRTAPHLSGLAGRADMSPNASLGQIEQATFNNELPSRLTVGIGYQSGIARLGGKRAGAHGVTPGSLQVSVEAQHYSSSSPVGDLDHRRAVTNYHLGVEIVPNGNRRENLRSLIPIRFGFRTIKNANQQFFKSDNAFTFGGAYEVLDDQKQPSLAIEPAFEWLTRSHLLLYSISLRKRF